MIYSQNGVISTSDDSIMHMAWQDANGEWNNCTVPAHMHYNAEGELLSCQEASKYAVMRPGQRVMKRVSAPPDFKGPVNLPR